LDKILITVHGVMINKVVTTKRELVQVSLNREPRVTCRNTALPQHRPSYWCRAVRIPVLLLLYAEISWS
jgi:hypothetical protein